MARNKREVQKLYEQFRAKGMSQEKAARKAEAEAASDPSQSKVTRSRTRKKKRK